MARVNVLETFRNTFIDWWPFFARKIYAKDGVEWKSNRTIMIELKRKHNIYNIQRSFI